MNLELDLLKVSSEIWRIMLNIVLNFTFRETATFVTNQPTNKQTG